MAEKEKILSISHKLLGYFGVLIFVRMSFKFLRLLKRMISFKTIPPNKITKLILHNRISKISKNNDRLYVIYNGLNSSITEISIFLIQARKIIEQFIKQGYHVILICDRQTKSEVSQMLTKTKIHLRIEDEILTLKTFRSYQQLIKKPVQESIEVYCMKKIKLLTKNKLYILINNASAWKSTSEAEKDPLFLSALFNHFIFISTILIKIISEIMLRNKGEHIIIGTIDKITPRRNNNKSEDIFFYNKMACKYFKNLHYILQSEYRHKINVTFVKNINYLEKGCLLSKNKTQLISRIKEIDIKKVDLNLRKNIQYNSLYALILYYINIL